MLRTGLIGAGNVDVGSSRGDNLAAVCEATGQAKVVAVYDIVPQNARRAADRLDGCRAFDDFEGFLDSEMFEAVIIASPLTVHAEQAIAALQRNIHVLSEVTPCATLREAQELVRAASDSKAIYMLAENSRWLDEIELVKRMVDADRFGQIYFGEGEYVHDCKDLYRDGKGQLTWRAKRLGSVIYCTHSLGPLLYIFDDRVERISCMANEMTDALQFDPEVRGAFNFQMMMWTDKGHILRVRIDTVSTRPHRAAFYSVHGTKGAYEAAFRRGEKATVWFADEHDPVATSLDAPWHPLDDYAETYIPERLGVGAEARLGGHGTTEYWMFKDFIAACQGESPNPLDMYRSLDYALPGIIGVASAMAGGQVMAVPDPRAWV